MTQQPKDGGILESLRHVADDLHRQITDVQLTAVRSNGIHIDSVRRMHGDTHRAMELVVQLSKSIESSSAAQDAPPDALVSLQAAILTAHTKIMMIEFGGPIKGGLTMSDLAEFRKAVEVVQRLIGQLAGTPGSDSQFDGAAGESSGDFAGAVMEGLGPIFDDIRRHLGEVRNQAGPDSGPIGMNLSELLGLLRGHRGSASGGPSSSGPGGSSPTASPTGAQPSNNNQSADVHRFVGLLSITVNILHMEVMMTERSGASGGISFRQIQEMRSSVEIITGLIDELEEQLSETSGEITQILETLRSAASVMHEEVIGAEAHVSDIGGVYKDEIGEIHESVHLVSEAVIKLAQALGLPTDGPTGDPINEVSRLLRDLGESYFEQHRAGRTPSENRPPFGSLAELAAMLRRRSEQARPSGGPSVHTVADMLRDLGFQPSGRGPGYTVFTGSGMNTLADLLKGFGSWQPNLADTIANLGGVVLGSSEPPEGIPGVKIVTGPRSKLAPAPESSDSDPDNQAPTALRPTSTRPSTGLGKFLASALTGFGLWGETGDDELFTPSAPSDGASSNDDPVCVMITATGGADVKEMREGLVPMLVGTLGLSLGEVERALAGEIVPITSREALRRIAEIDGKIDDDGEDEDFDDEEDLDEQPDDRSGGVPRAVEMTELDPSQVHPSIRDALAAHLVSEGTPPDVARRMVDTGSGLPTESSAPDSSQPLVDAVDETGKTGTATDKNPLNETVSDEQNAGPNGGNEVIDTGEGSK